MLNYINVKYCTFTIVMSVYNGIKYDCYPVVQYAERYRWQWIPLVLHEPNLPLLQVRTQTLVCGGFSVSLCIIYNQNHRNKKILQACDINSC